MPPNPFRISPAPHGSMFPNQSEVLEILRLTVIEGLSHITFGVSDLDRSGDMLTSAVPVRQPLRIRLIKPTWTPPGGAAWRRSALTTDGLPEGFIFPRQRCTLRHSHPFLNRNNRQQNYYSPNPLRE
jgi:hypothetical protein